MKLFITEKDMKIFFHGLPVKNGRFVPLYDTKSEPYICLDRIPVKPLYTLIMFDPDAVGGMKIHWLVTNIHLRSRTCTTMLPYTPPHPPMFTGRHRYFFWLVQQEKKISTLPRIHGRFLSLDRVFQSLGLSSENIVDTFFFFLLHGPSMLRAIVS